MRVPSISVRIGHPRSFGFLHRYEYDNPAYTVWEHPDGRLYAFARSFPMNGFRMDLLKPVNPLPDDPPPDQVPSI